MKSRDADLLLFFAIYDADSKGRRVEPPRSYTAFGDDAAWLAREVPDLCFAEGAGVAFSSGHLETVLSLVVSRDRRAAVCERFKAKESPAPAVVVEAKPVKALPVEPAAHVPLPGQLSFLDDFAPITDWERKSKRGRKPLPGQLSFLVG